ncbi:MAG: hypothetical protein BWY54_01000 [Candidatus Dependentiae bacterium ADurb.Bin331]|nr:MAG: hypothetical protein BWY54_01000 [Candidatus Dependentiae bacterium ADurb.Bin331]
MQIYYATVVHIIGDTEVKITIPKVAANSFCMATALVESMALSDPTVGVIFCAVFLYFVFFVWGDGPSDWD